MSIWKSIDSVFFEPGRRSAEAEERRIAAIQKIPTSSTNQLKGHRIERQLKFIAVSNHTNPAAAELDFREKVVAAGGSGAINVSIRHHKGGYVSVQGDAVTIV